MNLQNLIFLHVHRFDDRDYARFGFAYLKKNGLRLRVFQVADLLGHEVPEQATLSDPDIDIVRVKSYDIFRETVVSARQDSLFLVMAQSDKDMSGIVISLTALKAHYAQLMLGLLPPFIFIGAGDRHTGVRATLRNLLSPGWWIRKCYGKSQRIAATMRLWRCLPDFIVVTGEHAVKLAKARWKPATIQGRLVFANSLDYDLYLDQESRTVTQCQPYCVFIDDGFLMHPEHDMFDYTVPSPELYRQQLTQFFGLVEAQLGLPIKVALSPRSSMDLAQQPFGDREVVSGQTPDLIAGSQLVLAHCSTAIGLAVMFDKPVLLMETDELVDTRWGPIHGFAEALGSEAVNISRAEDVARINWQECQQFSATHYEAYRRDYISPSEAPTRRFWEIFIGALSERYTLPSCTVTN